MEWLVSFRDAVANDQAASSFQTMGQYRGWLLARIDEYINTMGSAEQNPNANALLASRDGSGEGGTLTAELLADMLHCSGLNAYRDYAGMGKSAEEWNNFRILVANELLLKLNTIKSSG